MESEFSDKITHVKSFFQEYLDGKLKITEVSDITGVNRLKVSLTYDLMVEEVIKVNKSMKNRERNYDRKEMINGKMNVIYESRINYEK